MCARGQPFGPLLVFSQIAAYLVDKFIERSAHHVAVLTALCYKALPLTLRCALPPRGRFHFNEQRAVAGCALEQYEVGHASKHAFLLQPAYVRYEEWQAL